MLTNFLGGQNVIFFIVGKNTKKSLSFKFRGPPPPNDVPECMLPGPVECLQRLQNATELHDTT